MSVNNEWVTVAQAASFLTQQGDQIDPSNVSRYLARFPEIPSRKEGKFRYVDLKALVDHRNTNVMVGEKRGTRGFAPAEPYPSPVMSSERRAQPRISPSFSGGDIADDGSSANLAPGNELNEANLRLKRLQIRTLELDQAEREGDLVPKSDVLAITSGAMDAYTRALEHAEVSMMQTYGREVGIAFRKARKGAQASAARELIEQAKKFLPPEVAAVMLSADGHQEP